MDRTTRYVRTPLPDSAKVPARISLVLWLAIISSPFVVYYSVYAVKANVDIFDMISVPFIAGVSLLWLVFLHVKAAEGFASLSQAHRDEYRHGKLFEALDGGTLRAAYEFELGQNRVTGAIARLSKEGVCFSPAALLATDFSRGRTIARETASACRDQPIHAVRWCEIEQWEVHKDRNDGGDYYRLILTDNGFLCVHRPSELQDEVELLDAIRSLGQTAVRLHCDLAYVASPR